MGFNHKNNGVGGRRCATLAANLDSDRNGKDPSVKRSRNYLSAIPCFSAGVYWWIFHADPHPGSLFYLRDGRVALLDCGMVGGSIRTADFEMLLAIIDLDGQRLALS